MPLPSVFYRGNNSPVIRIKPRIFHSAISISCNELTKAQPQVQRCPSRATDLPSIMVPAAPSIIVVAPCLLHCTASPTRAIGLPKARYFPDKTVPPYSRKVSPCRTIFLTRSLPAISCYWLARQSYLNFPPVHPTVFYHSLLLADYKFCVTG